MPDAMPPEPTEQLSRIGALVPEGAGAPVLLVTAGSRAGTVFPMTDRVVIGRAPESDLMLEDRGVSRHHAQIDRDGTGYLLRDLDSTNGTFMEGRPVVSHYLREGDTFFCGSEAGLKFGWEVLGADPALSLELLRRLPAALDTGEFRLVYQPIVDLLSREIFGVEALLRWNTPRGCHRPAQFLTLLEETGFIVPLGERILRDALAALEEFRRQGLELFMNINLTRRQLLAGEELVRRIPPGSDLVFDLAGEVDSFPVAARSVLASLSRAGARVALDDFGHVPASIEAIRLLPIKMLKLDLRFVENLPEDSESMRIAVAVSRLAGSLNVQSVAEGVENSRQYEYLYKNGYDMGQGFYFSKPAEPEEVVRLTREGTLGREILPCS
ncbi:MAG: EAL domain-containing protein [Armatimonadetes bacterium]|nr:EAL domain-containing protein [Armatimonadota bacterium]